VIETGGEPDGRQFAVLGFEKIVGHDVGILPGSTVKLFLEGSGSEFFETGGLYRATFHRVDRPDEVRRVLKHESPPAPVVESAPAPAVTEAGDGTSKLSDADPAPPPDLRRAEAQAAEIEALTSEGAIVTERRAEDQQAAVEEAFVKGTLPEVDRREEPQG
jgi:hypothetical protein